jgi:type I restriction enzyme M protein
LNNNKKERIVELPDEKRFYRNRKDEILFMDLREIGEPFEKKFTQFSIEHIQNIASTYHAWQQKDSDYQDLPEFCHSASFEEVKGKDFSLVPSKYIQFVNRDENIDFDDKMSALKNEITELLKAEVESKKELLGVFKELGYEIEL